MRTIFRCLVYYFVVINLLVQSQDIFDMFGDDQDQKVIDKPSNLKGQVKQSTFTQKHSDTCPLTFATEYRTVLSTYRNVIKQWLRKFPSKNGGKYRFIVELSSSQLDRLNKFASDSRYEEKGVLNEVHVISDLLKDSVRQIQLDQEMFTGLTWSAWLRSFDINSIIKFGFGIVLVGAMSFIAVRVHLRRGHWLSTVFIVGFICSVIQNWYALYQEAQAKIDEVLMKKLPKHCQGHPMGLWDSVKNMFGRFVQIPTNECLEYHKALRATAHAQVTPIQALSLTFAQLFTTPLGKIGEALSLFFAGTMAHVPTMFWPITMIIIVFIIIVVMVLWSRYEIHLPMMMGSIRPSALQAPNKDNVRALEDSYSAAQNRIHELESQVNQLQLDLEKRNLAIEHQPTVASARVSRSFSRNRTAESRERSVSSVRAEGNKENAVPTSQPTSPLQLGFKLEYLPS